MSDPSKRLSELIELSFCDRSDNAEQQRRLEQLILSDSAVAKAYVQLIDQEACLRRAFAARSEAIEQPPVRRYRRLFAATAALAAVAAALLLLLVTQWEPFNGKLQSRAVATLVRSVGCVWKGRQPRVGDELGAGRIELLVGLAEIQFASGVVLVAEGPMELDFLDAKLGRLHSGSIVVRVPPGVEGFVLETPGNRLIDRGTEFGVSVSEFDRTLLQVYDGEVRTETISPIHSEVHQVKAIQTLELSSDGASLSTPTFAPNRFVRLLPPASETFRYLPPSNRSRIDEIQIARFTAPPIIDGIRDEWGERTSFRSNCEPPFDQTYFVEGAMAYDDECLYVSAYVGDPFPLRNTFDPAEAPEIAWKGGAVRVRVALDPTWSYPLPENQEMTAEQRVSERFVHMLFWYHHPTERPCLLLTYGLDLHGNIATTEGWQGVFRIAPDRKGYVLEYAVPWSLLNVEQPRELVERTLAASWQVHWSNAEGRIWQGHLIDCSRPGVTVHPRSNANQWGRAVFQSSNK